MKAWAVSLAAHGAVLGLAYALWPKPAPEPAAEPFRWEVAFAPAPQPAAPEPPAQAMQKAATAPRPVAPPLPKPEVQTPPASIEAPAIPAAPLVPPASPAGPMAPTSARTGPPASESAAQAEAERRWHAVLVEQLRRLKRYPLPARRLGQEGVVLLVAEFAADGRLESVEVKRGSGYASLDRDALNLMQAAAEAARGDLKPGRPARLEVPVAYRLAD